MKIKKVTPDIYVLTGEELNSNATLITCEDKVLLVDGLASKNDAEELKKFIRQDLQKELTLIVCTHYFSDHMAAFSLLQPTPIIAHQYYEHTFTLEAFCSQEERNHFVRPTVTFLDTMTIQWGSNTLELFHNPGHTLSNITIDIPQVEIIITGDQTIGNIAYFYYSTPAMIRGALQRIKSRNRSTVITGHNGVSTLERVENSLTYLDNLERLVKEVYSIYGIEGILAIKVEQCVAEAAEVFEFDKFFHARNLQSVIDRRLFL